MVDINIQEFVSKSRRGTASRKHADRLDDVINVKEFGAKGDGTTDDTAAIQRALDFAAAIAVPQWANSRMNVYSPPGKYKITAPLNLTAGPQGFGRIYGAGSSTALDASFNGWVFDHNSNNASKLFGVIEGFSIKNAANNAAAGCIRLRGTTNVAIRNMDIQGYNGIQLAGNSQGGDPDPLTSDTAFESSVSHCRINGIGSYPTLYGVGLLMGPETVAFCNSFMAWNTAIQMYGAEVGCYACRCESNNIGVLIGVDKNGVNFHVSGATYQNASMEGNGTDFYVVSCGGMRIADVVTTGENDASHASQAGLRFWSGHGLVLENVLFGGSYTKTGVWIEGQPDAAAPGITFISTESSSGIKLEPGVHMGSCEQINCKGLWNFMSTVAQLPVYAAAGTRRTVTNANQTLATAWGTAITGGGVNTVPCWRDTSGAWRLG